MILSESYHIVRYRNISTIIITYHNDLTQPKQKDEPRLVETSGYGTRHWEDCRRSWSLHAFKNRVDQIITLS